MLAISVLILTLSIVLSAALVRATNEPEAVLCTNGKAGEYPCRNVDLLGHLSLSEMGAGEGVAGNDHWGWTDPETGRDYVVFGLTNGTAFVDITERSSPLWLGTLPSHDGASIWRDIKVYQNFAYITADIPTMHGLQVFDLEQLRDVDPVPKVFAESAHYDAFGPGHNLWINEETGFLYVMRSDSCQGEIHMVDLADPAQPQFAGCFAANDGPLSDSECVIYRGPDADYYGRELCFTGSDDNVSVGDVSDKSDPVIVTSFDYEGIARAHQGSLTPDHRYWLLSDTMDEELDGTMTRTYLFDMTDVDQPEVIGHYTHETTARDHNVYLRDGLAMESNWQSGLRILDVHGLPSLQFLEVGYFDTAPSSDSITPAGAWSNYPFWNDGIVTVSDTDRGLFILRPRSPRQMLPIILGANSS